MKIRYKIIFLLMTHVDKTSYFEVAPPGQTIAYKNIDDLKWKVYILIC